MGGTSAIFEYIWSKAICYNIPSFSVPGFVGEITAKEFVIIVTIYGYYSIFSGKSTE